MNRLIVGNWKHNPTDLASALGLAQGIAAIEVPEGVAMVVCPPAPYLAPIHGQSAGLALGAQDVSTMAAGAHTGEVGTAILADLGVSYVIVGHSERRAKGETDLDVSAKTAAVLAAGLRPIVCIGEPRSIRDQGMEAVQAYLRMQLDALPAHPEMVIAYEPIWAIGSGTADDPASAAQVATYIAEYCAPRIPSCRVLYGGSATPENAAAFLSEASIGGLLVGGASLDAVKFSAIVRA